MRNQVGQQNKYVHKQSIGLLDCNKRQRNAPYPILKMTVNTFGSCIFNNISGAWSQASINNNRAAFMGRYVRNIPTPSSMSVTTDFFYRATTQYSWAFEYTKTVKSMYIANNSHITLWLTIMEGQQSLTLCWHSFSCWGREHFTVTVAYKGNQYFVYDSVQPITPQIIQGT